MTAKVKKDKNGYYEGHDFNLAMLEAKLSGNHIKVMLMYLNVGGFDPNRDVFVSRKDYEGFGMVRQTVSTLRQELIEAGWLVPCERKSDKEYDYYNVQVGGPVAKRDRGRRNSGQGLSENTTGAVVIQDTEVTREVTTSINKETNDSALRAPSEPAAGASDSPSKNRIDKVKDQENFKWTDLIAFNGKDRAVAVESEPTEGVSQITTPAGHTLTETGELDW